MGGKEREGGQEGGGGREREVGGREGEGRRDSVSQQCKDRQEGSRP